MASPQRRADAGEGAIFQRKDGRWVGQLDLGWVNGRRSRRSFYGTTYAKVRDAMTEAKDAQRKGLTVQSRDQSTGSFLQAWLADEQKRLRPSTHRRYTGFVNHDLIPVIGRIPLTKLSPQHVRSMLAAASAGRGDRAALKPRTVRQMRAVLRKALNDAMGMEVVSRNVAALVKPADLGDKLAQPVMTPEQARAFLCAVSGDRLDGLYVLALATGLRQGEALGLLWDDVNFETGRLSITKALQRVSGKLVAVPVKTDASVRTLRLPKMALEALLAHRGRQLEDRLMAGERWQDTGYMFTTGLGTPLDGSVVTHQFQRLLAKAGLSRMRFHDLRHCAATLMAAQGVPVRVAMDTLGHSQIATTMEIYTHVLPEQQEDAADAIDAALRVSA